MKYKLHTLRNVASVLSPKPKLWMKIFFCSSVVFLCFLFTDTFAQSLSSNNKLEVTAYNTFHHSAFVEDRPLFSNSQNAPLLSFNVDFNAPIVCSNNTEWLVPIDLGAVPSSIGAISLIFDYDTSKMTYSSIQSVNSNLTNAPLDNTGSLQVNDNNGKVTISWANTSTVAISNATLITLRFSPPNNAANFSSITGNSTDFIWDQTLAGNCEFADGSATIIPATFNDQTNIPINTLASFTFSSDKVNNQICGNENIIFTATGGATYEFYRNNGTSAEVINSTGTYTPLNVIDGDSFTVNVINANGCYGFSNPITVGVSVLPVAGLTSDKGTTICPGETVTFTGAGGNSYTFDDGINSNIAGTGPNGDQFVTSNITQGQVITVTVTDTNGCSVTHAGLTMNVLSSSTISISSDDTDNIICINDNITFTATGGSNYSFDVNNSGNSIAGTGANNNEFSPASNALTVGTNTIKVIGTGSNGCSSEATITINVNPLPSPILTSDKTNNTVCQNELITFTESNVTNGTYQFFLNNALVTGSGNQYASFTLQNSDSIKVEVTDANGCIDTSSAIIVTVNSLPTPTLDSDDSDDRICNGLPIIYTATGADEYTFYSTINNVTTQVQAQSATNTYSHIANTDGEMFSIIGTNTTTGCESVPVLENPLDVDSCYAVSGTIVYRNSAETPMGNVVITVNGAGVVNAQVTTGLNDGTFSIPNLFDNETYTFSYSTTKTHGGINVTDAVIVLLATVFNVTLPGIYGQAADVNLSQTVTAADALEIFRRFIRTNVNSYSGGIDWAFEDGVFIFSGGDISGQKIYSLAMGDVNGSYTPNISEGTLPTVNMVNEGQMTLNNGDRVQIPIHIKDPSSVAGITLSMYHPSNVMTIHDVIFSDGTSMLHDTNGDELRSGWMSVDPASFGEDDVIYYLDATIHDIAAYNTTPIGINAASELADPTGMVIPQVVLGLPSIEPAMVTSINDLEATVENVRHFPNPFSNKINIVYDLPSTSQVSIDVFNSLGQQVATLVNDTQIEGTHQIAWEADNQTAGMYYYRISVNDGYNSYNKTKHIVLVR